MSEASGSERFRGGEPFKRSLMVLVGVPLLMTEFVSNTEPLTLVAVASLIGMVPWVTSLRVLIIGGVWIDGDDVVIKNAWSHAGMPLADCEIYRGSGTERSYYAADWAFGCEVPRRLARRSIPRASDASCCGEVVLRTSLRRRLLAARR